MIYKIKKQVKMPKYFKDWFRIMGLMDDNFDLIGIERIAWRAYKKGVRDTKKKQSSFLLKYE